MKVSGNRRRRRRRRRKKTKGRVVELCPMQRSNNPSTYTWPWSGSEGEGGKGEGRMYKKRGLDLRLHAYIHPQRRIEEFCIDLLHARRYFPVLANTAGVVIYMCGCRYNPPLLLLLLSWPGAAALTEDCTRRKQTCLMLNLPRGAATCRACGKLWAYERLISFYFHLPFTYWRWFLLSFYRYWNINKNHFFIESYHRFRHQNQICES